jgi:hypothetical protein
VVFEEGDSTALEGENKSFYILTRCGQQLAVSGQRSAVSGQRSAALLKHR